MVHAFNSQSAVTVATAVSTPSTSIDQSTADERMFVLSTSSLIGYFQFARRRASKVSSQSSATLTSSPVTVDRSPLCSVRPISLTTRAEKLVSLVVN